MIDRAAPASSHKGDESAKQVARFPNLRAAGTRLPQQLQHLDVTDTVVLAIANAGVPVAREVADQFDLPIDILIIRRLFVPRGAGSEICAVSVAGRVVLDEQVIVAANPTIPIEHFIVQGISQLQERAQISRGDQPPLEIAGRKILLVDCAIHTASTMKIAIRALRTLRPMFIVAAVPVASREGDALVERIADEVVCLALAEPFGHAGMWYYDFDRPSDEEVRKLLDRP